MFSKHLYIHEIIIKLSSFPTDYLLWSSVRYLEKEVTTIITID